MTDYTPTTEVIRHAVAFPRERLGEPRPIKPEAFDRWLEQVKAEARAGALADAGLLAQPFPTRAEIAEEPTGLPIGFDRWLEQVKSEAWDEGYTSGRSNAMRRMSDEPKAPLTRNPYRKEQDK